mgnify:CR=1 FL=1
MRRMIGWIRPQIQTHSLSPQAGLWRKIKIGFVSLFAVATVSTIGMAILDYEKLTNDLLTMSANAGLVLTDIQVRGRAHTPVSWQRSGPARQLAAPRRGRRPTQHRPRYHRARARYNHATARRRRRSTATGLPPRRGRRGRPASAPSRRHNNPASRAFRMACRRQGHPHESRHE